MTGKSKTSKDAFNLHVSPTENIDSHDTDASKTNKDNADKRHDPKGQKPAPNLAPPGMSGNKGRAPQPIEEEREALDVVLLFEDDLLAPDIDLSITDDLIHNETLHGIEYIIKQEAEGFERGLDGGRISRLTLIDDGNPIVHFVEGEWVYEPKSPLEHQTVYHLSQNFGGELETRFDPPMKNYPDIDDDFDI